MAICSDVAQDALRLGRSDTGIGKTEIGICFHFLSFFFLLVLSSSSSSLSSSSFYSNHDDMPRSCSKKTSYLFLSLSLSLSSFLQFRFDGDGMMHSLSLDPKEQRAVYKSRFVRTPRFTKQVSFFHV